MAQIIEPERVSYRLPVENFVQFWPQIVRELDRIPQYWAPWWTKESLMQGVLAGRFQAWGIGTQTELKIMLLTQIVNYPAASVLYCFLMFGHDEKLEEAFDALEPSLLRFANEAGCKLCEVQARPGFKRALKKYGFVQNSVVLSRAITERIH